MVDDLAKPCGTYKIFVVFDENTDLVSNASHDPNDADDNTAWLCELIWPLAKSAKN